MKMLNKIENIFIIHVFSEFSECVAEISEQINDSVLLRKFALFPYHLGNLQAYTTSSIETCLKSVTAAKYVVCLIGESLGAQCKDGVSYVEFEIKAALKALNSGDIEGVFIYLIGDKYEINWRKRSDLDISVSRVLMELECQDNVVLGIKPTNDIKYVGAQITKALERHVLQVFDLPDEVNIDEDPMVVSCFRYDNKDRWPEHYARDLKLIFGIDSYQEGDSQLAKEIAQRNKWALDSIKLGHVTEALSNINKVLIENGSDFFSCFWKCRLIILSEETSKLKKARECGQKVVDIAKKEKLHLVQAIALTLIGYANYRLEEYQQAETDLNQATELVSTLLDARLFCGEFNLYFATNTRNAQQKRECINKAVESLLFIIKSRFSYYIYRSDKLKTKFGRLFDETEVIIFDKLFRTYQAMNEQLIKTQQWVRSNLKFELSRLPNLNYQHGLFKCATTATDIAWCHFQLLSVSIKRLEFNLSKLENAQKEQELWSQGCLLWADRLNDFAHQSQQLLDYFENLKTIQLQKKAEHDKAIGYLRDHKSYRPLIISISIATCVCIFLSYFSVLWGSILAVVSLVLFLWLVIEHDRNIKSTEKEITLKEKNFNEVTAQMKNQEKLYAEQFSQFSAYEPHGDQARGLFENAELEGLYCLTECTLFVAKVQEVITKNKLENVQRNKELSEKTDQNNRLMQALYHQINEFEQHAVSAHNGQYTYKIRTLGKCQIVKKLEQKQKAFELIMGKDIEFKGSCLVRNGDRRKAYTDLALRPYGKFIMDN